MKLLSHLKKNPLQILLFFLFAYFCFEYKPIEHRLYHVFYKAMHSLILIPKKIPLDLLIFLTDLVIVSFAFGVLKKTQFDWKSFFFNKEKKWLTLLVLCAISSLLLSPLATHYDRFVRIGQLFFAVLLFCSIYTYFSQQSCRPFLKSFFLILFLVGFIESAIALLQYFHQDSIGIKKLGEVKALWNSKIAMMPNPGNGKLWIFPFFKKVNLSHLVRPSGTFPHPNILAGFLFLTCMIGQYFLCSAKTKLKYIIISFAILLQTSALIITFCRTALFALVLASIYFFITCMKKNNYVNPLKTLVFSLGLLLSTYFVFSGPYQSRGGIMPFGNSFTAQGDHVRVTNLRIALRMLKSYPFTGVGYDHFPKVKSLFAKEDPFSKNDTTIHNIPLLLAAETGIFGLLSACFFVFSLVFQILKTPADNSKNILIAMFLGLIIISLFDYYFLFFQQGKIMFFSITALLASMNLLLEQEKDSAREKETVQSCTPRIQEQNVVDLSQID